MKFGSIVLQVNTHRLMESSLVIRTFIRQMLMVKESVMIIVII